jgi:multiple antibiotic resistance protein
MLQINSELRETEGRVHRRRLAGVVAGVACLIATAAASAAELAAAPVRVEHFPVGQVFTILFLMLGPFKLIGPFLKVTAGADDRLARRIALMATVFAALALLFAGFLGDNILNNYGIELPVLALSGGIILFLVALKTVLEQFAPPEQHADEAGVPPEAAVKVALSPLAFPAIVTPYGIAGLIVFLSFSQSMEGRLTIGAIVAGIMALNLVVMLLARRLPSGLSIVMPIVGAVLGVVQVALGLAVINNALHDLGIL